MEFVAKYLILTMSIVVAAALTIWGVALLMKGLKYLFEEIF